MSLRVLVFGGRGYADAATVDAALSMLDVGCIIHGGARGADTLAGDWGKRKGLPVLRMDAPWDFYGNRAGPVRNQWLLDWAMPTYAVGFPGGSGTRDMAIRCATARRGVAVMNALAEVTDLATAKRAADLVELGQ